MFERDLGEMGESVLRNWAAQVGITANKATLDKRGWDFILEFPIEKISKNKVALDKMIDPIQCFIQVKSTDNNNGSWSVKLSNWVRLVKTSLPAFFLVLDFNKKNICQKAYIVHIWKDEIENVLKRLREISTEIDSFDLNKKTLSFNWNEDNLISPLSGEGLLRNIQANITDFTTYAKRKKDHINNVGYEKGRKKIDLQLMVPKSYDVLDPSEFFVDLSLGLLGKVEVNSGEIRDLRFAIPAPQPEDEIEKGSKIEVIPKPVSEGILLIRDTEEGEEIRIPAQFYAPAGVAEVVNFKDFKFLFKLFEDNNIVLIPNNNVLKYNINIPDPFDTYALNDLHNLSKLILFFSKSKKDITKEIEVFYSDKFIAVLKMRGILIPDKFIKWATLVNKVTKIAKKFDILKQINVKVVELWNQEIKIDLMLVILGLEEYDSRKLRVDFNCDGKVNSGDNFCIPFGTEVTIGEYKVLTVGGYIGQTIILNNKNKKYRVEIEKIEIMRKHILKRDEELPKPIHEFMKEIEEKYIDTYNILHEPGMKST